LQPSPELIRDQESQTASSESGENKDADELIKMIDSENAQLKKQLQES